MPAPFFSILLPTKNRSIIVDDALRSVQEQTFGEPGSGPVVVPKALPADLAERLKKLDADIAAATKLRDAEAAKELYPVAYGVSEDKPVNVRIQLRGEPDKLGEEVPRRFLGVLGGDKLPASETGSGRLELANWLTRPSNPLTARVMVNRIWRHLFGAGLVRTMDDFGVTGEAPSHPELLDYLAARLVEVSRLKVVAMHAFYQSLPVWRDAFRTAGAISNCFMRGENINRTQEAQI